MLKTKQILGSSSSSTTSGFSFVPQRLKKPCSNFLLISRKPIEATVSKSSETPFWASQFRKVCFLRAFQMSRSLHSESTPFGPSPPSSSTSTSITSTGITKRINFCESCGGATKYEIPDGEERMRAVCTRCGKIAYENPKMVVGCLIEHENKILLCKRNIQPSQGLWTIPAGFMEIGESAAEGAIRETLEEANAEVEVESPFAQLDLPLIGQTYIIFLAKLKRPQFSPGPESSECQLFALEDIPYESLAFSSMLVTLKLYMEDKKKNGRPKFHYGIINKRPGTSPSDIHAYTLEDHFTC